MQYRKFGNTDLLVSEIGFGAWAIGGAAMIGATAIGWGDADDKTSVEAIHAALDAGFRYGVNKEKAQAERERLFKIIEDLVQWDNTNNEEVLDRARAEIRRSWRGVCELNKGLPQAAELFNPDKLPGFHDPFAGDGALPLEAQCLGLESYASDLNPVAVTINMAMIEIPPKFAGRPPVNPESRQATSHSGSWKGAQGLAEDVRYYGQWMRDEAEKRIGHLYPNIEVTAEMAKVRPDLKPYGMAPGPCSRLGDHRPHGPGATPLRAG